MSDAFATVVELAAWLPSAVSVDASDAPRLLGRATELVADTVRAFYAVDPVHGLPTDPVIAQALSDATCAVVEQWVEVGEENDYDGLAGTSVSVAGRSGYVGYRAPTVGPRVMRILKAAGLLGLAAQRATAADEFFLIDADEVISG